ncbi:hypothetical protein EV702DRAFT_1252862 [Suillus placidus]|uniref:Uncharacterized protein n=1 Tax=Suillus placidus TaxID=48579 RepID=A0A9P7D5W2_9AGAM|nr:hypothetical protein EV702DRAFT_1252862 [Suillus placidus]
MTPHYSPYGKSTTEEAAKHIAAFIAIRNGLKITWIFAAEVYDQNAMLTAVGIKNFASLVHVIAGNGLTDFYTILTACVDTQCTGAAVFLVQSISSCIRAKQALPRCQKWLTESCINPFDTTNFQAASRFCETEILNAFFSAGKNPYNISKDCDEGTMCYSVTKYISSFLDRPSLREKLSVGPSVPGDFSFWSDTVRQAFVLTVDECHAPPMLTSLHFLSAAYAH